jgi:hypothetical protein
MEESRWFHEYLTNLSVVAITFAGFTTLATSLVESGKATKIHLFLIDNIFILGFIVVISLLLQLLLDLAALFDETTNLQVASAIAALLMIIFCATYKSRRSKVLEGPWQRATIILIAFYCLTAGLLVLNIGEKKPALYAFALTAQQTINVFTFLVGLRFFITKVPKNEAS